MYSFYYMLSHSIDWHLLDVMYNILNTQRYATSVAGQTCSCSDKQCCHSVVLAKY